MIKFFLVALSFQSSLVFGNSNQFADYGKAENCTDVVRIMENANSKKVDNEQLIKNTMAASVKCAEFFKNEASLVEFYKVIGSKCSARYPSKLIETNGLEKSSYLTCLLDGAVLVNDLLPDPYTDEQ